MIKNILGPWGANLDDDDYACALAALGVLESTHIKLHRQGADPGELAAALEDEFALGERTPVWRQAKDLAGTTIAAWHETEYGDPAALAAAWRQFSATIHHERELPRIAVPLDWRDHHDIFNVDDLCSWLQRADGLNSLVMAKSGWGPESVAWHWPLRVGLPEGPEHAAILDALRAAQRQRPWVEHLARCFTVGSARDACDLLILSAPTAGQPENTLPGRVRASFVACLEDPPSVPAYPRGRYRDLQERLRAAGVAAVGRFDSAQLGEWFVEVLRQVSHDVPIHAALWSVGRHHFNRDTLIIGHPAALDTCRILAIAERQDRIVATTSARTDEIPTTRSSEPTFGGTATRSSARSSGDVQPRFADEIRGRMFTSESVDGETVASDFERRGREIHEARAPRWIHAEAWRSDSPTGNAGSLAPAQWNVIAVHIGPSGLQRSDAPFPDSKLDFTRGNVGVNVQMELAGSAVRKLDASYGGAAELLQTAAQFGAPSAGSDDGDISGIDSSEILLPPTGASRRAWFAVYPPKRKGRIEGRISIIHNNRVLQTARLWIEIDRDVDRGQRLVVRSEANIHTADEDLVERRAYDVAIQVSDVGGKLHLTIDRDGQPLNVRLDNLSSAISRISEGLERIAKGRDFAESMVAQPVFTETLYTLAAAGAELEQHLRKKCGNVIDGWERIHLVPSTNEFFPLEYVYDGSPPNAVAAACPNLLSALDRGSCDRALGTADAATPCPHRRENSFMCPMHFWGFRKLIERNGTVEAPEAGSPGAAPASTQQVLCVPGRQAYCKINGLLFAASNRAFLYAADAQSQAAERQGLVKALSVLCGTVSDASDWDEWRRGVTNKPNLLVLIAHTDEYRKTPVLEIGDGKLLGRQEILNDISGAAGQPQLLILLGCSAADVMENFQPYPERFRAAGVSIVLAPVASIRGADAVPIARRLAELLADNIANAEPTAFGDLLPVLRRRLLRDGHAGVMAVVGFGDGDWLIGGQPC